MNESIHQKEGLMSNISNFIILAIFAGMAFFMTKGYISTKGKVVIRDRKWSANRILFAIAGVLALSTAFVYQNIWDIVRLVVMLIAIVMYLLTRDGIGEEGIVSFGRFTAWEDVRAYDYKKNKKTFDVFFVLKDSKSNEENYTVIVNFDLNKEDEVVAYLKEKIGRKYTRMKK